jgi:hypothetical protein
MELNHQLALKDDAILTSGEEAPNNEHPPRLARLGSPSTLGRVADALK